MVKNILIICTKIIIAHRLATIREADYIVFIENGKAVENGTLEDLLMKNSRFHDYWSKQVNISLNN
jgi:ABC-type multidrug transport system fused ATPase/permease subunit